MKKMVDLTNIIDLKTESDIYNKLTKEIFFDLLKEAEIDLDKIAKKRRKTDYAPYHSFNFLLKELHEKKKIDITDACIYIDTDFLPEKEILKCLNEENVYLLRMSLAERNNIKIKRNSLELFMR
jgi:hypothetical protein